MNGSPSIPINPEFALGQLRSHFPGTEAVLLSTCNRVKLYTATNFSTHHWSQCVKSPRMGALRDCFMLSDSSSSLKSDLPIQGTV